MAYVKSYRLICDNNSVVCKTDCNVCKAVSKVFKGGSALPNKKNNDC